ncbi:MAG: OB-fold domain-containing protein [Actinobacteria bacterium]|nr:OB-fold domain-containing protein [Actinomycetota bacterium]
MTGIVSYGVYVPYWRLRREAITSALGTGGGRGTRSVASYDEDTTSMGVEAARTALAWAPVSTSPTLVALATTAPAYLDKTNANAIHAALALPSSAGAVDCIGSVRSGAAAVMIAQSRDGLAVLSDIRIGLPGGADESAGGDAAVALLMGDGDEVIAETIGAAEATGEFVDRWRTPGDAYSKQWEERFGEHAYLPFVEQSFTDALKSAGLTATDLDHVVVTGLHTRAVAAARRSLGVRPDALADDLTPQIGNTGVAHGALVLADVLDRAEPGQLVAVVQLADGCSTWLLRVTPRIAQRRPARSVREAIAVCRDDLSYNDFLTWRGMLHREPPRRPEPDRPAAPPSLRSSAWKYGLFGSRDEAGFVHLPPSRVSMDSGAIDRMELVRMADVPATIATFTVDRLAFSLSPPVVAAVIDFDAPEGSTTGGRFQCELTDVDPSAVRIGDRVEMTFRRLYTQDGIHNYFWKARPLQAAPTAQQTTQQEDS